MNILMLLLLIPIVAILARTMVKLSDIRHSHSQLSSSQQQTVAAMQAEITALKQRIQVLETLVTDEGFELKRNINRA